MLLRVSFVGLMKERGRMWVRMCVFTGTGYNIGFVGKCTDALPAVNGTMFVCEQNAFSYLPLLYINFTNNRNKDVETRSCSQHTAHT